MFARARTFLTIAALTLTMPAVAQAPAPTTTPFDGTYAGVSLGTSSFMQGISAARWCASTRGAPAPLTITNGVVRSQRGGSWEGSVSPQGVLVMRNARSIRVEGQIDSQGTIRAQYSGWACVASYVWQKQSQ
jgi:hypothetical protein